MKKVFLALVLIFSSSVTQAQEDEILNVLTQKIVTDFHQGIKTYNDERDKHLPEIRIVDETYSFTHKKNQFRFSLINYLNDDITINNRLVKIPYSDKQQPKTSYLDFFIRTARADDEVNLDAASTKVLLQTLGAFSAKLEKIGFTCVMASCKKEVREKNLAKIKATLSKKKQECDANQADTTYSIKKYDRTKYVGAFAVTLSSEYNAIKDFMKKIVNANKKEVNNFLEANLNIEDKSQSTCVQVLLSGTAAAPLVGHQGGLDNLATYGKGVGNYPIVDEAKKTCLELSQLKSCLVTLQQNSETINSVKRQAKQNDLDTFPDVTSGFSKAMSK